jgi:hypothetical protein
VILQNRNHKGPIKKVLDEAGVPSQFILVETLKRAKIGVYSNILKQMNAKVRQDLYRLALPAHMNKTMVVGTDVVNEGKHSLFGFAASYSNYLTQYLNRVIPHDLYREVKKKEGKDKQEECITKERARIMQQ